MKSEQAVLPNPCLEEEEEEEEEGEEEEEELWSVSYCTENNGIILFKV
jgi:hypothetical protein